MLYFVAILGIGKRLQKRMRDTDDYYLAGRRMGKVYQFFLNFGSSTDSSQAVAVSREIYRQGIAGMWIQYLVLFLTPFYWFTTMLFRRARLTTIGDFFTERFDSKFLGGAYAVFMIVVTLFGVAVGYMVAAKTFMALTPKPESAYTAEERRSVEHYQEFQELQRLFAAGELSSAQGERLEVLRAMDSRDDLRAFVSYVEPLHFYLIFGGLVCIYVVMGGFAAAAITDTLQGILMILFSCLLIPFGLAAVGGFDGLHAAVPEHMFWLFGAEGLSEYAWYTIAAMAFANLVSIVAVITSMQTSGSAVNEGTARFGMIGGMMFKRFIMIFWALAGLIALTLYAGELHDPDLIWGHMAKRLLGPGFVGVMMVGVLAASMSTLDTQAVALSALFVNQVYRPVTSNKSDRHYMRVGQIVVVILIFGGIGMALYVRDLLELFKYFIAIPAIFGAAIWLGFMWRRVTRMAVIVQTSVSFVLLVMIPNLFQSLEVARTHEPFLQQTSERRVEVETRAVSADVEAGRADFVGQRFVKNRVIPAYAIFYDRVARTDPTDSTSPAMGFGRFNAEIWLLSLVGFEFTHASKAQLVAIRFAFDACFPIVMLIVLSFLTKPVDEKRLDLFFAKIHTPVQASADADALAILENAENMQRFGASKLFPKSQWELHRPSRLDYLGFFGTWALVGLVILVLWGVVSLGR